MWLKNLERTRFVCPKCRTKKWANPHKGDPHCEKHGAVMYPDILPREDEHDKRCEVRIVSVIEIRSFYADVRCVTCSRQYRTSPASANRRRFD